jgi:superfamily II DNA or RNA helicase/HKD family nuclease
MPSTLRHYDAIADSFFSETVGVDMSELHDRFLSHLPEGGMILDAGCGSGRDSKTFLARGFRVRAFDGSTELARMAGDLIGQPARVCRFEEFEDNHRYDGVWACASLLHIAEEALPSVLARLWQTLKPLGLLYVSFKLGDGERLHGERHFTDATEPRLRGWLRGLPDIERIECWITRDVRPDRDDQWLNGLIRRKAGESTRLITGERTHPFLPQLLASMAQADEIDLAVSFVKTTGLRLLLQDLHAALGLDEKRSRPSARLRVVTSDYLDVTDPDALRLLMLLQHHGALVRIFESAGTSFHMKAYLFARFADEGAVRGTAFIGSSNISRMALTDGLEWNYRIEYPGDEGFLEARCRFETLFRDARTVPLTDAWIDRYEARRVPPPRPVAPGSEELEAPPTPTSVQINALAALTATRRDSYRRGLVVLATGLGKTWLAAFDAEQMGARRVLFIAHREEILSQAAETFVRIRPRARVGFYMGQVRDTQVDVLCASVQTLGKVSHLDKFAPQHFDYIIIDEFHHAAAPTYRRLLNHFVPQFLLGLTATPDRTDQSDILTLCDDNLVFTCDLFSGISAGLLAPFHYYGIWDETVDYQEIPWRSGRFDPDALETKLATLARARHALKQWQAKAQTRTLAFCVSIRHAEFMAEQFVRAGINAAAVYAGSPLARGEALQRLSDGELKVIFSVDLFNEGVDLPAIDTVLMLRPTESKILFLQQLGRGLRKADGKEKLVALDFIGNHQSFLHKPQALAKAGATYRHLADFARKLEARRLELPPGCFINYDLELIEFLKALDTGGASKDYAALKGGLGRRPTLTEFYRSGASLARMRGEFGTWFEFVAAMGDLADEEVSVAAVHRDFLREVETTQMTKSFKMVLLEAFQELDGWSTPPALAALAESSWQVLQRRRPLLTDLSPDIAGTEDGRGVEWRRYWRGNPVNAWIGGNRPAGAKPFFELVGEAFAPAFTIVPTARETLSQLVQEVVDYRLAAYEVRHTATAPAAEVIPFARTRPNRVELPYFPNLPIACGHFKTGRADAEEHYSLGAGYGRLDPARHFIARASGNSMNGGKNPIRNGDYLLLERVTSQSAGSITGSVMAIERQDEGGDDQYLLRVVTKTRGGGYVLKANNPEYVDLEATEGMRTIARLKAIIDPLDLAVGRTFQREEIPALFGETFNPGNWNVGHVVLRNRNAHVLLVTINKQGKAEDHRYLDHWIDEATFHWQSQNSTTQNSSRGREIINHEKLGISLHLFIRKAKLEDGKAAAFVYEGPARYKSHTGSGPMSVILKLTGDRI